MTGLQAGYRLAAGEGDGLWFLNTLLTVKADTAATRGAFTLIEQLCPPDFAAPPHIHSAEEEGFYVLEGDLTVTCGDSVWAVSAGGFVLLPRGIPHSFTVAPAAPARLLQVTSPAQFERFAAEVGEPATAMTLPTPQPPDIGRLIATMSKYGYALAGAPPGP